MNCKMCGGTVTVTRAGSGMKLYECDGCRKQMRKCICKRGQHEASS